MKHFLRILAVALLVNLSAFAQLTFNTSFVGTRTVLTNGNTSLTSTNSTGQALAAINVSYTSGKWYGQFRVDALSNGNSRIIVGVGVTGMDINKQLDGQPYTWGFVQCPNCPKVHIQAHNGTNNQWGVSVSVGDIIGVYWDLDNGYIYIEKNGLMMNGGDPGSGALGTGALWSFPTGMADYYFLAAANWPIGTNATSEITLISPATGGGYGFTNL